MNQSNTTGLLLSDLKKCKPRSFTREELDLIADRLNWAYGAGFDAGRRTFTKQKAVVQLDKLGNYINTFPSFNQAGRSSKIFWKNIYKVTKGERHTAGGYQWMLESDYKKLKGQS